MRMPRPESTRTAGWLSNRELGRGTRRWRLSLEARQLGADERPMHGTFLNRAAVVFIAFRFVGLALHRFSRALGGVRAIQCLSACLAGLALRGFFDAWGFMDHPFRRAGEHLGIQRRLVGLSPLARNFRVLVDVLEVARGAPRLLHLGADHGHDRVVADPPLARAVIVENVTKPKLALLHQVLPNNLLAGMEARKALQILAELVSAWQ